MEQKVASMEALMIYDWPGNVRELRSVFEYAFVTCQESLIQPLHLPVTILQGPGTRPLSKKPAVYSKDRKKQELIEALRRSKGNQSEAARILGISRVTVWNRMKQFGILARGNFNL